MYPPSDTPRIRPQGLWRFLGPDEKIRKGDLARSTSYLAGYSDYICYGAARDMDWRLVGKNYGETLGAWIGKTLREFHEFCGSTVSDPQYPTEVIRKVSD